MTPIAVSHLREKQEAMLLMRAGDWVRSTLGVWQLRVRQSAARGVARTARRRGFWTEGLRLMRYAKGGLVINPERDIPLLRQVRNSRFVSHQQLFEFMKFGGFDHCRNSFNWRVRRLVDVRPISICEGRVWRGIGGLSDHARRTCPARTSWPVHDSVLHSNTATSSACFPGVPFARIECNSAGTCAQEPACRMAVGGRNGILQYHFADALSEGLRRHCRRVGRRQKSALCPGV